MRILRVDGLLLDRHLNSWREGGLRVYPLTLIIIGHARLYIETFPMTTTLTNYMKIFCDIHTTFDKYELYILLDVIAARPYLMFPFPNTSTATLQSDYRNS